MKITQISIKFLAFSCFLHMTYFNREGGNIWCLLHQSPKFYHHVLLFGNSLKECVIRTITKIEGGVRRFNTGNCQGGGVLYSLPYRSLFPYIINKIKRPLIGEFQFFEGGMTTPPLAFSRVNTPPICTHLQNIYLLTNPFSKLPQFYG